MLKLQAEERKYRNASRMGRCVLSDGDWYEAGAIATIFGFVSAYRDDKSYSICFIWNGKEYEHRQREAISEAALVRRASKFAKQIVGDRLLAISEKENEKST